MKVEIPKLQKTEDNPLAFVPPAPNWGLSLDFAEAPPSADPPVPFNQVIQPCWGRLIKIFDTKAHS